MTALHKLCLKNIRTWHAAVCSRKIRVQCAVKKGGAQNQVDSTASKTETLKISGRAKREGDNFLIVYISYNARYTKYRGVKKPLSGFSALTGPPQSGLACHGAFAADFAVNTITIVFLCSLHLQCQRILYSLFAAILLYRFCLFYLHRSL